MKRGLRRAGWLFGGLGLLLPAVAWCADPVAQSAAAAIGKGHASERAADFLASWLQALSGPDAAALDALYATDFVGQKQVGKRSIAVTRADFIKALRPDPSAPPRLLQIREAKAAGSRKNLWITLRTEWRQGKQSGQDSRHMVVVEQGGRLWIRREQLTPGRPSSLRSSDRPWVAAPLPKVSYRCAWASCSSDPSEQAEVQSECSQACERDAGQCAELAEMLQLARCGATLDVRRAIDLWDRSCQVARDARSCAKAAQLLSDRKEPGDIQRALSLLGCQGPPSARTCQGPLAAQLLVATADPKQVQRALSIYLKACGPDDSLDGSAEDCERAAAIYKQGLLGTPDSSKADELQSHADRIRMEEDRRAVEDPRANRHGDL